eukprot:97286_1
MSTFSLSSSSLSNLLIPINGELQTTFKNEQERYEYLHRFSGELYPKRISRRMVATSCIMGLAAFQALYWECYVLCMTTILVVLISINFWRKPTKGIRRSIDIFNNCSATLYHMIYALFTIDNETSVQYIILVLSGLIFYSCSKICSKRNLLELDSFFHCSMHLYGTCVNCWFYPKVYQYYASTTLIN